jgi:3-deoxy-7-phosphoheptulonate synthase
MRETNDLHVTQMTPLPTPDTLKRALPVSPRSSELVYSAREQVRALLRGQDHRLLVVVGPCSIHDPVAALEYATRLRGLTARFAETMLVVMRVYFEKPRTSVGWKGLINDPRLDGTCDVAEGMHVARQLLLDIAELGLPAASEMLDPIVPQYIADLVSWGAIGARTAESQTHREMASGLSMPVGFKNATDGSLAVAVNAIIASARQHRFVGIDGAGRVSVVHTSGNPDGHLVLRGGHGGPNYDSKSVTSAARELERAGLRSRVLIDCSHDNSDKDHENQVAVVRDVARQLEEGSQHVLGVMIESNLVAGRQAFAEQRSSLRYGQSITDACVDLEATERMLERLDCAHRSAARRPARLAQPAPAA